MKKILLSLGVIGIVGLGIIVVPQVSACNRPGLMLCPSLQVFQMADKDELKPLRLYQVQSIGSDTVHIAGAGDTEVIAMYGTIRNDSHRTMSLDSLTFQGIGVQYIDIVRMYSADRASEDILAQGFYTGNGEVRLQFLQPVVIGVGDTYDFFLTVDIDPTAPTGSLIRVDHEYKAQGQNIQVLNTLCDEIPSGISYCGDGLVDCVGVDSVPGTFDDEECDDGNTVDGDGCSAACLIE